MSKFECGADVARAIYYAITDEHDVDQFDLDDWDRHVDEAITILNNDDMLDEPDVRRLIEWAMEDEVAWNLLDNTPLHVIAMAILAEHEFGWGQGVEL